MKRLLLIFALLGMTVLFVTGCGDSNSPKSIVEQYCKSTFAESKKYIEPCQVDLYERTGKELNAADAGFPKSEFAAYTGKIREPKISGDTAEVEVAVDNMISLVFDLKKVDGKWYISRIPSFFSAAMDELKQKSAKK